MYLKHSFVNKTVYKNVDLNYPVDTLRPNECCNIYWMFTSDILGDDLDVHLTIILGLR